MSTARNTIIQFTTAPSGSGKTYLRCARFLADDLLPETDLRHISNFPYDPRKVADYVAAKYDMDYDELLERMFIIPHEVMESWRLGESGPWEYFDKSAPERTLDGAHVAIDEIHNFCGTDHKPHVRQKWMSWVNEIRHQGATIEFISQTPDQVARQLKSSASVHRLLTSSEELTDPWFHINLCDWYELRALIFGKYLSMVYEQIGRREGSRIKYDDKKEKWWYLLPEYFELYDSYSTPTAGGHSGGPPKREFERRSAIGLVWWFVRRNAWLLLRRLWIPILIIAMIMGGGKYVMTYLIGVFSNVGQRNMPSEEEVFKATGRDIRPSTPEPASRTVPVSPLPVPSSGRVNSSGPAEEDKARLMGIIARQQDELIRARLAAGMSPEDTFAFDVPTVTPPPALPASSIVFAAVLPGRVVTTTGEVFSVGEEVRDGDLLESVDVREGRIVVSGRVVRLGQPWLSKRAEADRQYYSAVARRGQAESGTTAAKAGRPAAGDNDRPGVAASRVAPKAGR